MAYDTVGTADTPISDEDILAAICNLQTQPRFSMMAVVTKDDGTLEYWRTTDNGRTWERLERRT